MPRALSIRATFGHNAQLDAWSAEADDVVVIWCRAASEAGYAPPTTAEKAWARSVAARRASVLSGFERRLVFAVSSYLFADRNGDRRSGDVGRLAIEGGADIMIDAYYSGVPADFLIS